MSLNVMTMTTLCLATVALLGAFAAVAGRRPGTGRLAQWLRWAAFGTAVGVAAALGPAIMQDAGAFALAASLLFAAAVAPARAPSKV